MSGFNRITFPLTCSAGGGLEVVWQPLHRSSHLLFQGQHVVLLLASFQGHRLEVCGLAEQTVDMWNKSSIVTT